MSQDTELTQALLIEASLSFVQSMTTTNLDPSHGLIIDDKTLIEELSLD